MPTRDLTTNEIMLQGLNGFSSDFNIKNLQEFIDTFLTEKWNAGSLPEGFTWDDNIDDDFEFSQMEVEPQVYQLPSVVDYDSTGKMHSFKGAKVSKGAIPTMKHGFNLNENVVRKQLSLFRQFNAVSDEMKRALGNLLFDSVDKLVGGNHNMLNYMRHQVVSRGELILTNENNPDGIEGLAIKMGVPDENKRNAGGFNEKKEHAAAWTDLDASDPIEDLREMYEYATDTKGRNVGHFEMSKKLYNQFKRHPKVKARILTTAFVLAPEENRALLTLKDDQIQEYLSSEGLPPIKSIDSKALVDSWDKKSRTIINSHITSFKEDVVALVPDGRIGTIKAVRPLPMASMIVQDAYFDGGRTYIKQYVDARTEQQTIESRLSAIPVPYTPSSMFILTTSAAAS